MVLSAVGLEETVGDLPLKTERRLIMDDADEDDRVLIVRSLVLGLGLVTVEGAFLTVTVRRVLLNMRHQRGSIPSFDNTHLPVRATEIALGPLWLNQF